MHTHWRKAVLLGFGVAAFLVAVFSKPRPSGFPTALLYTGVILVGLAVFEGRIRRLKFGDSEVELAPPASEAAEARQVASEVESGKTKVVEDSVDSIARYLAGQTALNALLDQPIPVCGDARFMVYLLDEDTETLLPIVETGKDPSVIGWKPGLGVTGASYLRGEYLIASGTALRDSTFGLTSEQRLAFADLTCVASTPILNAAGRIIGVLSAATNEPDPRLRSPDARDEVLTLAAQAARVLIDLLKWFSDA